MPTESAAEQSGNQLETAGGRLRQVRRERNLSQKEVADQLHITVHYVKALETDKYEKLPGTIFAKGYIKSYAELLGLDSKELAGLFERYQSRQEEAKQESAAEEARRYHDRNRPWVLASVIIFAGIFVLLWVYNSINGDTPSQAVSTGSGSTLGRNEDSRVNTGEAVALQPALITPASAMPDPQSVAGNGNTEQKLNTEPLQDNQVALATENARGLPTPERMVTNGVSPDARSDAASPGAEADTGTEAVVAGAEPEESGPRITVAEQAGGALNIHVASSGSDVLKISFSGESWVEVNDADARSIYQNLREAGDVLEITGNGPFNILLGDAPLATLEFNGAKVDVSDDIRIDNSARLTVGL